MTTGNERRRRLAELTARQERIHAGMTAAHHEALVRFFVRILPRALAAERCSIFVVEPGTERIWVRFGTGLDGVRFEAPRQGSVVGRSVSTGEVVLENGLDRRHGFHEEVESKTGFATRSLLCVPVKSRDGGAVIGAIEVLNRLEGDFVAEDGVLLLEAADYLSAAMETVLLNEEVWRLTRSLNNELERVRQRYPEQEGFVARSPAMRKVLDLVGMVSQTPVNVLVQGGNGTGKELIARMIHDQGARRDRAFVAVNCASIPEALMESEFFGYERGAFTGAAGARAGRFEEADGGTLFLDEIGDMPFAIQAKFLRVLQEGEGSRLGSNRLRHYDLRVISATNKPLREEVAAGRFREDLYHRLFAVEILLPPLRERREDIGPLTTAFVQEITQRFGKHLLPFPPELTTVFERYPWPGNVRQLRREVERLVALTPDGGSPSPDLCSAELRQYLAEGGESREVLAGEEDGTLPEQVEVLERRLIRQALEATGGNKLRAAERLGITRQGLHKKLNRYGIRFGTKVEFEP
ncbi:sigma-54-dependent Fis family transcriptional regulator [Endothiovibrio diazotrophicus]